tara:strand:- start:111 stop:485 length:375 start_codon:yes stop_codon:yes gene_type:complete
VEAAIASLCSPTCLYNTYWKREASDVDQSLTTGIQTFSSNITIFENAKVVYKRDAGNISPQTVLEYVKAIATAAGERLVADGFEEVYWSFVRDDRDFEECLESVLMTKVHGTAESAELESIVFT